MLKHTGTSWEDFFRQNQPPGTRTVDGVLFRTGGTPGVNDAPATLGKGFLIDNLRVFSGAVPKFFVLLADEDIQINGQVNSDGDIHANNDIFFNEGNKSQHTGNLTAVDDIIIKKKNKIIGTAAGDEVDNDGTITGAITENANVAEVPLPTIADFDAGDDDVEVDEDKTKTLVPGDYSEVKVEKGGKLKLSSGTYNLESLELGEKSVLSIDLTSGLPIVINVDEKLEFGKKVTMKLTPSTASTSLITFNIDDDVVVIGEGSKVFGSFIAPEATVEIGRKARFKGAVCAENIIVQKGARFVHHSSTAKFHNADEPQPKRLTGENRANREGNDWEILFSFLISVYSVFSVLKNLCFFCTHFTC